MTVSNWPAEQSGRKAQESGKPETDNPFPICTDNWYRWMAGFRSAEATADMRKQMQPKTYRKGGLYDAQ